MKLLYVTKTSLIDDGGGGEERAREVVSGLASRNHDVTVVCGKTKKGLKKNAEYQGCEIRHVWCGPEFLLDKGRLGFLIPRYLFAFCSLPVLVFLFARERFDVTIENMTPYPTLTVILARLFAVPIIAVQHEFHGRDCIDMYDPVTGRIQLVVQRLLRAFSYDTLVVPAAHVKQELKGYGVATDRIEVVPNGIDYEKFRKSDIEQQSEHLVTVGRLCKRKGQDDLLQAFASLQESRPEAHLDIVGAGPRREQLEELTERLDIEDAVTFHGFVDEVEKIRLLNRAEIFVFASRQEGFGLVLLEAMAAGTPVVARKLPVYEEFFEDNVNGVLVDEPFLEQFPSETEELLKDKAKVDQIGRCNQETAANYGWESTVDKMESIALNIGTINKSNRWRVVSKDDG